MAGILQNIFVEVLCGCIELTLIRSVRLNRLSHIDGGIASKAQTPVV
jgi:hypothetical protein